MQMCLKPLPLLFPSVPGAPLLVHHFCGKLHIKVRASLVVVGCLEAEMVAMVVDVEVVELIAKENSTMGRNIKL